MQRRRRWLRSLAFNATVETSHAGTEGRGFAVVAENVRKLADEASKAAAAINAELGQVLHHVGQAARLLGAGQALAEVGRNDADQARQALRSILDSVAMLDAGASKLQNVSSEQLVQSEELGHHASQMEQGIALVADSSGAIQAAMEQLHASLAGARA